MTNSIVKADDNPSAIMPLQDVYNIGKVAAASGLFGVKTAEQAISLCLIAQAQGLHPATAMMEYHVINNRPSMTADAMLARFMRDGGTVEWKSYTDDLVSATFTHPKGGSVTVDWDNNRVKAAGLTGNHSKYPRQMKRARCISEGVRTVCPGVILGFYTPEEVTDLTPDEPVEGEAYPRPKITRTEHVQAQTFMVESGELAKTREATPRPFIRWNVQFEDGQTDKVIYYGVDKARLTLGHDPVQYRGKMQATLTQLPKGGYRAEDVSFLDINKLEGPIDAEYSTTDQPSESGAGGSTPVHKEGLQERIARESERGETGPAASD